MTYPQILHYLYTFIPDRLQLKFDGEKGIKRIKHLLNLLDNPQEKIRVIHIAGTSGKGSTANITSSLLIGLGFKTGLQISPHLLDLRERFQINNQLISKQYFCEIFKDFLPLLEQGKNTKWGKITFFEILVAFSFYLFYREKVDYAVIETGLGGLLDGTNVVENTNKVCVLTQIGLDHQWILGHTLTKIAEQKAGIINIKNTVVTLKQNPIVNKVFMKSAQKNTAKIFFIEKNKNFKLTKITADGSFFNFNFEKLKLKDLKLNLIGLHQIQNASLALTSIYILSQTDNFEFKEQNVRQTLGNIKFPSRFEIIKLINKKIILDGAHNPQKMNAFLKTLRNLYPNNKFDFLISFSRSKDQIPTLRNMLRKIVLIANQIYISDFTLEGQDSFHQSVDTNKIASILTKLNYKNYKIIKRDNNLLANLTKINDKPLIITGSLYFLSSLYKDLNKLE